MKLSRESRENRPPVRFPPSYHLAILQGTCGIRFEESRTVFEMRCPALECRDETFIQEATFDGTVYAIGVDDCEFQRFM